MLTPFKEKRRSAFFVLLFLSVFRWCHVFRSNPPGFREQSFAPRPDPPPSPRGKGTSRSVEALRRHPGNQDTTTPPLPRGEREPPGV